MIPPLPRPGDPRDRGAEHRARRDRRLSPGSLEGRAEPASRTPAWPLRASQPSATLYLPFANKGVGPSAGTDSTPIPSPVIGTIIAVEIHAVCTTSGDSTFQFRIAGTLVGDVVTLAAGLDPHIFYPNLAAVGLVPVSVNAGDAIQLSCITADAALADLGGLVSLVH